MALLDMMKDISLWFYRGEGNDTIVVGLTGQNLVLRLKKRSRQMTGTCESFVQDQNCSLDDRREHHYKSLDFSKNVFLPLMGGKYVRVGEVVRLAVGFATELDTLCEPYRPKHRLHKGIDPCATTAVAMADFCLLPEDKPWNPHLGITEKIQDNSVPGNASCEPTFSVEIKPKCGFIPSSPYIREENLIKISTCHYCMLQRMKVSQGKYARPSKYCPVDLFSGDKNRVFFALKALISDPQNNLRIFKDGFPVFTEEIVQEATRSRGACCSANVLKEALVNCGWEHGISGLHQTTSESHTCDKLCQYAISFMKTILKILVNDSNIPSSNIPKSLQVEKQVCKGNGPVNDFKGDLFEIIDVKSFGRGGVLKWLKLVQSMDDIDVEGLYPLYSKVKNYFDCNPKEREGLSVDGPYDSDIWKEASRTNSTDIDQGNCSPKLSQIDSWSTRDIAFKICQYAVASTAKDCSIMLTFQKRFTQPKHLPFIVNDTHGSKEYIVYNIDLVDLDPKEFDRVKKYYNDSCNAVRHYLKALSAKSVAL